MGAELQPQHQALQAQAAPALRGAPPPLLTASPSRGEEEAQSPSTFMFPHAHRVPILPGMGEEAFREGALGAFRVCPV